MNVHNSPTLNWVPSRKTFPLVQALQDSTCMPIQQDHDRSSLHSKERNWIQKNCDTIFGSLCFRKTCYAYIWIAIVKPPWKDLTLYVLSHLVYDGWPCFTIITIFSCVGGLLIILRGKHWGNADHWQWHITRDKLHRAQRHGPHFDLLEGLGLCWVTRLADKDIFCPEAFWMQFEVFLQCFIKTIIDIKVHKYIYFLKMNADVNSNIPWQTWPHISPVFCWQALCCNSHS